MIEADSNNDEGQPKRLIAHVDFGLWKASVRLGVTEYVYGFFGSREDAERLLALAFPGEQVRR